METNPLLRMADEIMTWTTRRLREHVRLSRVGAIPAEPADGWALTVAGQRIALGLTSLSLAKLTSGTLTTSVRTSLVSQLAVPASTAWAAVPLATGFTGDTYWRIIAGQVRLAGTVTRTAGNFPTGAYETILTLPAAAWPSLPSGFGGLTLAAANNAGAALAADIGSTGALQIRGAGATPRVDLSTITPWAVA